MILKVLTISISALFQSMSSVYILYKQDNTLSKKNKILFFINVFLLNIINGLFIPNEFRFIFCTIMVSLIIYFILQMKGKYIISYSFIIILILSISEVITSLIMVILGINALDLVNNLFYNMLANIFISILALIIIKIPIIYKIIKQYNNFLKRKPNMVNYLCGFLIILYLITLKNGLEFLMNANYYVNVVFMVLIILIIVIILKKEFQYDQLTQENKQMLNYVTKYEKIITEQGKANHEFKNQLMVIRGYAQMNKPDKLIEYLDSIVSDSNKTHSSYLISQLNKFPDGGIKGLLYYKLSIMDDDKIKYEINVEAGVKTKLNYVTPAMYKNITKILGVLLDNAIDASKKCNNKKIIIDVTKESSKVIFSISNTYKGKIDITKIGTGYTSKGSGHGYGLKLVKDIVEENKSLNIQSLIKEDYYTSKLIIKTRVKKKK